MPRPLPARAPRDQPAKLLSPKAGRLVAGALAADVCFEVLASGEGTRVGLLGDPGSGKSTAARHLAQAYLTKCRGLVAIADSKGDGDWPGECFQSVDDLAARGLTSRELVFSPDPFGEPLDLEQVAQWQWSLAARRCKSLVVYDEMSDACDAGEFFDGSRALPRVFTHGRRVGISALWGAQFAQLVPRAVYECTPTLLVWRQAGNALAILRKRGYTHSAVEAVIKGLPGGDGPPSARGAFVLLRRGRPWDGRIYRF